MPGPGAAVGRLDGPPKHGLLAWEVLTWFYSHQSQDQVFLGSVLDCCCVFPTDLFPDHPVEGLAGGGGGAGDHQGDTEQTWAGGGEQVEKDRFTGEELHASRCRIACLLFTDIQLHACRCPCVTCTSH